MSRLRILPTADGSHTLFNEDLDETYHSVHGAVQESAHVFIKNGLDFLLEKNPSEAISVLEIGFGTGLNALLTLEQMVHESTQVRYTAIESFPLPKEIWSALNYPSTDEHLKYFARLHTSAWDTEAEITPHFLLFKMRILLEHFHWPSDPFDLIYYDAFAPSKQPEMWTLPILSTVTGALRAGGIFVTYCAKGQLKRDLRALGLQVETLAGPPGKKEMVRAIKN